MVHAGNARWVEVSPSQFPHEAEGLALVRDLLPDETPFRAWSNFEFRDSHGRWHEVDLLLLGRGRLFLIELKYYSGVLTGNDHTWLRAGRRPEDSPLKLARRKAQYLASKLKDELRLWARETGAVIPDERAVVPFVQEAVFLHHSQFRSELPSACAINLFGLDGAEGRSNLPPISDLVLEPPGRRAIGGNQELILTKLLQRIGLVQRREREAGSWVIEAEAVDSGEGWQDWLASHKVVHQDRARIRFQVASPSASEQVRADVRRIAEHEYRVMSRLHHDGLLRPRDLVESELGVGLVYPYDPAWERLDLWLAGQPTGVPLATQLSMIRQVGESLQYAHGNKVVHRGLSPRAVVVRPVIGTASDVKVRVGDWQGSGAVDATGAASGASRSAVPGVTSLLDAAPRQQEAPDPEQRLTEAFRAPEGVWNRAADRIRLDVFGLGALAFYLLAGRPPAPTASALKSRLQAQRGLDLAVELPQISSALRSMVLRATCPTPTERTPDVATVLAQLGQAEREAASDTAGEDPLEATPGAVLDGRFRLERRLGQGSTAVGLLVTDLTASGSDATRVLKVALDDEAAARLTDEAEVLRGLNSPRVVKVIEGPLVVGGRQALLLESAGSQTLTDVLRARTRLSVDLLDRYGTDLLDGLVALDRAGVDHRDIKPANLGVREGRGDRTKHLVLFDFSLTRAPASATSAGTPPYLDPFFGGARDRYDSAAERYAAAVVLFEMATGATPVYGDGECDPATVEDEAIVEPAMFDPALAEPLTGFFRTALARDPKARHDTAESMRNAWREIVATSASTQPDEASESMAQAATLATPLARSGLTARALSALEPYAVHTVGELLTVDAVRLARMSGVTDKTRREILGRVKSWRSVLGEPARPATEAGRPPSPADAAEILLAAVASRRAANRAALSRLVLGVGTDLDAFATHAQLGASLPEPVSGARATQLLGELQDAWAGDDTSRGLLDALADAVTGRLGELGGVATPGELTDAVLDALTRESDGHGDDRLARGLLRFAVERRRALSRADGAAESVWTRRREGAVVLLADEQALLDVAEAVGRAADGLVVVGDPDASLVPAPRVADALHAALPESDLVTDALREPMRLARLGAALAHHAAASGAGELHHRDLSQRAALKLTFAGFGGGQQLSAEEIRQRVRVRFPAVPRLPKRPTLDVLVDDAGLALVFDDRLGVYRAPASSGATTGLEPRQPTSVAVGPAPVYEGGPIGARLAASVASRSFLALGVRAEKMTRLVQVATLRYAARPVDVTAALLDALRDAATRAGVPWDLVRAADAEGPTSRGRRGLGELVRQSWPAVEAAVEAALAEPGDAPVLLVEAAPMARYDNIRLLARWSDLGAARRRPVWLVVPQLGGNTGALLDGIPVPLAAPSQYLAVDTEWVDTEWVDTAHRALRPTGTGSIAEAAPVGATKEG